MNEYYARDTSRKIRSTFQSKGKSGKHLTGTVIYGYLWNEARDQWLVDFSDGMNDTEQQPGEEGESSDETAYD